MADPFQELGITRRPLFEMFGLPEDRGASSPRMAQAVQNDRITQAAQMKLDQDFADIERRGQAEAAADEFVRQNPDAAMAGSRRYNDIQQYQQIQQRGPSYSDQVLSRSLANRLKPAARERFYQNLEAGMGANASYDDAEAEEEDMKLRVGLAEAGVPLEALPPPGERIDPVKAAALRAAQKGGGSSGKNPEMQALEDNYEMLRKEYEDARSLGEVSPELEKDYLDTRGELLKRRRSLYTPQQQTPDAAKQIVSNVAAGSMAAAGGMAAGLTPAASVAAGVMSGAANAAGVDLRPTGAATPPPAEGPTAIPASVPYNQIPAYLRQIEAQKAKAGEEVAVSEQWTQQKSALQKRLEAAFPDKPIPGTKTTQLEAIARAVLNGDLVPDESGAVNSETGEPLMVPAGDYALLKVNAMPDNEAFAETGNLRTGPQGVSNRELAKAWAEEFVKQRGLTDKEPSAGALPTEVRQKARAKVLEQIDNG